MPKPKNRPKLTNCSPKDVIRALKKLKDFEIEESAKHILALMRLPVMAWRICGQVQSLFGSPSPMQ